MKSNTKASLSVTSTDTTIPANSSMFRRSKSLLVLLEKLWRLLTKKHGVIVGVVTEADLFSVYFKAQSDVHKFEHG